MNNTASHRRIAAILLRVALASAFLSAVADRFGFWGAPGSSNVGWGTFVIFLEYTEVLLWFLPVAFIPACGWIATILEVVFAIGLLSGYRLRWFAVGSAGLLFTFALTMTISLGFEPAFSYSVWTACASALLLACLEDPAPTPPVEK